MHRGKTKVDRNSIYFYHRLTMKLRYQIRKTKEYSVHETYLWSVQATRTSGVFQTQRKYTLCARNAVDAAVDKNDKDRSYEKCRTSEAKRKLQVTRFKELKRSIGSMYT